MDLFYLKLIRIFLKLKISIPSYLVFHGNEPKDDLLGKIFESLDHVEASVFYLEFKKAFPNSFVKLLKPHFLTVIAHIDFPQEYIRETCQVYGSNFVFSLLKEMADVLKPYQYREAILMLYEIDRESQKKIQNLSPFLFQLYHAIEKSGKGNSEYFSYQILFPMMQSHVDEYIEWMNQKLFYSKPLEIQYLDAGSSSYVFDVNGKVVKLGNYRKQFPLIMHYRMNDFYIRRRFQGKERPLYIEVCPKGNITEVTEEDIENAIADLKDSGIIVTDLNYRRNFAHFLNEEEIFFQDVEGIVETRVASYSESYQKKKVKLIDHEYVYDRNDPHKEWIQKF